MAPFAGKGCVPLSIPVQTRLPKPGTRRNDRAVALGADNSLLQYGQILIGEHPYAPCGGFEVVQQNHPGNGKLPFELISVYLPGKIGHVTAAPRNRTSDGETRGFGMRVQCAQEISQNCG